MLDAEDVFARGRGGERGGGFSEDEDRGELVVRVDGGALRGAFSRVEVAVLRVR